MAKKINSYQSLVQRADRSVQVRNMQELEESKEINREKTKIRTQELK